MEFSGPRAVLGTQLAEVFSVEIRPYDSTTTYQVYGSVRVKDDVERKVMPLYDRPRPTNPDEICGRGLLPLVSAPRPISAVTAFTIDFYLKHANDDDCEFIKTSYMWSPDVHTSFDTCLSAEVHGKLGSAIIHYAVFPVALRATVDAKLHILGQSGRVNLYGTVIAHFEDNFHFPRSSQNLKDIYMVLFDQTSDKPEVSKFGASVPLSRPSVTVPAYSRLVIEADLWHIDCNGHKQQLICGRMDFRPEYIDQGTEGKIGEKDHHLFLAVRWETPVKLSQHLEMGRNKKYYVFGGDILEIHSVRIFSNQTDENGADENRAAEVYGTFLAGNVCKPVTLFAHGKYDPVLLSADNTIPLTGPFRSIELPDQYGFQLSLYGKHNDMEICNGHYGWSISDTWHWYNKPLSTVIEGEHGYGVIHFTVLERALQANVEVTLHLGDRNANAVYGTVVAYYWNVKQHGEYTKNYLQTKLFEVPKEKPMLLQPVADALEVTSESMSADAKVAIPLSRYAVGVPGNSDLIIDANLNLGSEVVSATVKFCPQSSGENVMRIESGIDVKVSWFEDPSTSPGMPPPEVDNYSRLKTPRKKKKLI